MNPTLLIAVVVLVVAVVTVVAVLVVRARRRARLGIQPLLAPPAAAPAQVAARAEAAIGPGAQPARAAGVPTPGAAVVQTVPIRAASGRPAPPRPTAQDVAAFKAGLAPTRGGFVARLTSLFGPGRSIDASLLDEIEAVLLSADVGGPTTRKLIEDLRARLDRKALGDSEALWASLREQALLMLDSPTRGIAVEHKPTVILVVGVNGVGKTTTIGKLASRFQDQGKKVVLAAGDTFRAAAVLQLEVWGRRVGCEVVKSKDRADPGSVIFDAIKRAQQIDADVVLADTAGRLHTKAPLMEELAKLGRTVEKALGRAADEVVLVLDATTGQNAVQQVQIFRDALPLTGVILTKLDGTAKGGVILGIASEHRIPVRYVGIGERMEDLREFDARAFVEALFDHPGDGVGAPS